MLLFTVINTTTIIIIIIIINIISIISNYYCFLLNRPVLQTADSDEWVAAHAAHANPVPIQSFVRSSASSRMLHRQFLSKTYPNLNKIPSHPILIHPVLSNDATEWQQHIMETDLTLRLLDAWRLRGTRAPGQPCRSAAELGSCLACRRLGGRAARPLALTYTRLVSDSAPSWSSRSCFTACHF